MDVGACYVVEGPEVAGLLGLVALSRRPYAVGCWEYTGPGEHPCAELDALWVRPSARRRGVGRALLRAALDWTRAEGLATLCASVEDQARDGAASALRACGFRSVVTRDRYHKRVTDGPAAPREPDDITARPLTEADLVVALRIRAYSEPKFPRTWHLVQLCALLEDEARASRAGFFIDGANEANSPLGYAEVTLRAPALAEVEFFHGFRLRHRAVRLPRERRVSAEIVSACEAWARARGCARLLTSEDIAHERYPKRRLLAPEHGFEALPRRTYYAREAVPPPPSLETPAPVVLRGTAFGEGRASLDDLVDTLREHAPEAAAVITTRIRRYETFPDRDEPTGALARIWRWARGDRREEDRREAYAAAVREHREALRAFARSPWATRWDPEELLTHSLSETLPQPLVALGTPTASVRALAQRWTLVRHTSLRFARSYDDALCQQLLRSPYLTRVTAARFDRVRVSVETLRRVLDPAVLPQLTTLDLDGEGGAADYDRICPWESPDVVTATISLEHLRAIAACEGSARLRHLGVAYNALPAEAVDVLLDSPNLRGLRSLRAVPGNFDAGSTERRDAAVARLARRFGDGFGHYKSEYVQGCLRAHGGASSS